MKYFESLGSSFMSHYARRLADLINEQASDVLQQLNLCVPASAISTLQFINLNSKVTVAHIADAMGVSHQMATQRINALEKLSLVKRVKLPSDQRAKQIKLSNMGQSEIKALHPFMKTMKCLFDELENELGHELSQTIYQAELSLQKNTLKQRFEAKNTEQNHA